MTDLEIGQKYAAPSVERIKRLEGVLLSIKEQLAGNPDPETKEKLALLMRKAKASLKGMQIDRTLALATPKQLEAFGAFCRRYEGLEQWNIIHVCGSNQSGKTFMSTAMVAFWLVYFSKPGQIIWCIAPSSEKSVATQQKQLWKALPPESFGDQVWTEKNGFGSKNPLFVFEPQGRRVTVAFKTLMQYETDERSIESGTIDGLWIDESVTRDFHDKVQMRLAVNNGWEIFSSIPDVDWTEEAFDEAKPEARVKNIMLLPEDNPAMSQAMFNRMSNSIHDEDERNMRLFGKRRSLGAKAFPDFDKAKHTRPAHEMPPLTEVTLYAGLDVGLDHPTVWLLAGISRTGKIYVFKEYCQRGSSVKDDVLSIKGILRQAARPLAMPTTIDPSTFYKTKANMVTVAEQYKAAGLMVRAGIRTATIGEMNLLRMIRDAIALDNIIISHDCPELIRNFKVMKFKRTASGAQTNSDQMEDKNNDAYDAFKYIFGRRPTWYPDGIPPASASEAIEW